MSHQPDSNIVVAHVISCEISMLLDAIYQSTILSKIICFADQTTDSILRSRRCFFQRGRNSTLPTRLRQSQFFAFDFSSFRSLPVASSPPLTAGCRASATLSFPNHPDFHSPLASLSLCTRIAFALRRVRFCQGGKMIQIFASDARPFFENLKFHFPVEVKGLEPMTLCLQSRCSPN